MSKQKKKLSKSPKVHKQKRRPPRISTGIMKKRMVEALIKALGIVTLACKSVGIDRKTHYNWLADDSEYKAAVDDVQEVALDFAESQLHKKIASGDNISTIFFLKCRGKSRGYIERTEQTGKDGAPLHPSADLSHLSYEQLLQLAGKDQGSGQS